MAAPSSSAPSRLPIPAEAVPGALLVLVAAVAMVIVNSPAGPGFTAWLKQDFAVGPAVGGVVMSISDWIKNAMMAIFFFFVGLELKRELLEGQLSSPSAAALPVIAAAGGMIAPALIFLAFAGAEFSNGWAIPAATDIAFALGVLSLMGARVPAALKAFLLAVAVVDDLGAILIVAIFYTENVAIGPLMAAGGVVGVLAAMAALKAGSVGLFVAVGVVLWVFMQQSGVSPTLAGVIVAAFVPLKDKAGASPLHRAEEGLRPWVMFGVMPVFALANAGVPLAGAGAYLLHPITLGIGLGLAIGKPLGIAGFAWLGAKLLRARLPGTLPQVVGVACIAGIGFTMSLFIGALAFTDPALAAPVRLGVYAGSIASAVLGLALLSWALPKVAPAAAPGEDETAPVIKSEVAH
jgi:NhaA family Na+:H+ antiporter